MLLLCISLVTILATISGCTHHKTDTQPDQVMTPQLTTCEQGGGHICNTTQLPDCAPLNATDTFRCYSCECTPPPTNDSLTTDTFTELFPFDDTLEDIQ